MAVKGRLHADEQWERVKKFILDRVRSPRGARPTADDRDCFEGILWVYKSGARWIDSPEKYRSASNRWRRLH